MTPSRVDFGHRERLGMVDLLGNREGRAIGQHTRRFGDCDLARPQQAGVEAQRLKAPPVPDQPAHRRPHQALGIAILLLEVLGPEEHALGPDDSVLEGHGAAPEITSSPLGATSRSL